MKNNNCDKKIDVFNNNESGTTKSATVYGFHISNNTSNPYTCVTYLDDAVGKTPVHMGDTSFDWGDWDENEFFIPRPCMLKYDGTVDYYLDPNDYTKKEDGTPSDVSDTSYGGNAMMEWGRDGKKIWYKLVPDINNIGSYSVYISDDKADDDYVCWNFYDCNNHMCNHFYTPIYNGSYIDSCMRSLSNQTPGVSTTGRNEVSYARKNNTIGGLTGDMWYTETYGDRMLVNYLLVLLGKSLNTQGVYGNGNCESSSALITGTMNDKGLFWGNTINKSSGVKVFGMEHWWGNVSRRTAGLCTNSSYEICYKLTPNNADGSTSSSYSTSYNGMINSNTRSSSSIGGGRYIKSFKVVGDTIVPYSYIGGTANTYYCDYMYDYSSSYATYGGCWNNGPYCGSFCLHINNAFSSLYSCLGCALSFRGE